MTIEEDVAAALRAGSPPSLVYPEVLPQQPVLPAATYTVVAGSDDLHLEGIGNTGSRLVQVDTWASTRLGADTLMVEMQSLMLAATAFTVVAIDMSGAARYEPDTTRYRASKEFTIQFD